MITWAYLSCIANIPVTEILFLFLLFQNGATPEETQTGVVTLNGRPKGIEMHIDETKSNQTLFWRCQQLV